MPSKTKQKNKRHRIYLAIVQYEASPNVNTVILEEAMFEMASIHHVLPYFFLTVLNPISQI